MTNGTLIEFGGLPGAGKSTPAGHLAERGGAVRLRIGCLSGSGAGPDCAGGPIAGIVA